MQENLLRPQDCLTKQSKKENVGKHMFIRIYQYFYIFMFHHRQYREKTIISKKNREKCMIKENNDTCLQ